MPETYIKIVTNGDFLNKYNYKAYIEAGVSIFYISKHGKKLKKSCRDLLESLPKKEITKNF